MARSKQSVTVERRVQQPPHVVFEFVSDAMRQPDWLVGGPWASCKVQHANGPLRGPNAVHIRVLEDATGTQSIDRLETAEFEDEQRAAFSDGRFFAVRADGGGTLVVYGQELLISSGMSRKVRKAFKSEGDLLSAAELEADMDRIERALADDAEGDGEGEQP